MPIRVYANRKAGVTSLCGVGYAPPFGSEFTKVMQNTSHAVMAQRTEAKDSLDDFPTPPWATRALIEHVVGAGGGLRQQSCLEPACGAGHMVKVLAEYFGEVICFDVHDYKYAEVANFLTKPLAINSVDWVITNPPFRLAEEFVLRALTVARKGVAILARTVFIESVGRHERLYQVHPPAKFAQFTERVPMVKGRLDRKASTATGYGWLVWEKGHSGATELVWIPQCRKALEREGDYELPPPPVAVLPVVVEVSAPVRRKKASAGLAQESLFGL